MAALVGTLFLAACSTSAEDLAADTSLTTAGVVSTPVDATKSSDEVTIRNAVSSADVDGLAGEPLPWANADTGSRGAITELAEFSQGGKLCRRFVATRESYDGVGLFKGETCSAGSGLWRMPSLQPL